MKNAVSIAESAATPDLHDGPLDFAFIVHPRDTEDILRAYPHLRGLPVSEIVAYVSNFSVLVLDSITVSLNGRTLRGELLSVPQRAGDFRRELRQVQECLFDVLDYCAERSTKMIGLGALLPSITHHGRSLAERAPVGVGITTGHSYTGHAIAEHIRKIEMLRGAPQAVAIVGAAGSTGQATIDCLLSDGINRPMTLIDLPQRLESLAKVARDAGVNCSANLGALLKADIVVCVTNATHSIIQPDHLSPYAIVIDDAQPPNISLDVVRSRSDVIVLKCLARVPSLQCSFDFGLFDPKMQRAKQDHVFTCLAETVMLAASDHSGHFTIGQPWPMKPFFKSHLANFSAVSIKRLNRRLRHGPKHSPTKWIVKNLTGEVPINSRPWPTLVPCSLRQRLTDHGKDKPEIFSHSGHRAFK